jgi:hypothetical protein
MTSCGPGGAAPRWIVDDVVDDEDPGTSGEMEGDVRDPTTAGEDAIEDSDGRRDGTVSADVTLDDVLDDVVETGESGTRYLAYDSSKAVVVVVRLSAGAGAAAARVGMSLFDGSLSPPKMLL